MLDLWNKLPESFKALIFPLILAILFFFVLHQGYLVTGRTFDREMGKCERDLKFWQDKALENQ